MTSWTLPLLRAAWGLSTLACLLAWQGAAHGQGNKDLPVNIDAPIYLKVHDKDRWLITPARSGGWPAARHGDASQKSKHKMKSKEPGTVQIKHGDVIGIEALSTTDEGYVRMYCSDGSWAWYDVADKGNDKQWWTVWRAAGEGVVNHGDNIRLRNVNWPDYYLNLGENGTWGTVSKNSTWLTVLLEKPVPPVTLRVRDKPLIDIEEDVIYVKNFTDEAILGAEQKWSLSETQQVGLGYEQSDSWDIGVMVGSEFGNEPLKGKVEVSTSFGQTMTEQRTKVKELNIAKEVTLQYSMPKNAEGFLKASIKIPYQVWDASCADINLQLRALSGNLALESLEVVVIPRRLGDKIEPVTLEEVEECIDLISFKNPTLARTLRDTRLPVWKRNGWVTGDGPALPKFVQIKNVGTGKWLTHEGGLANQNWISSTADKNRAVVWEVVGELNNTSFRAKDTNLFLSYKSITGACKFENSDVDATFKMKLKDGAWTALNNRHQTLLWMYSDPYPYVRSGGDGDTKARWTFEAYETSGSSGTNSGGNTISGGSPMPQKPLEATALLGSYQRNPAENDWHKGQITAGPNNTLVWTNAAGVSWKLTPDLASKVLRTGADNPYADQGVRDFAIELRDGQVTGFSFGGDAFGRVASSPSPSPMPMPMPSPARPLDATAVLGTYQRNPVENDWHKGQITAGANNTLIWTNAAGVSWKLTPDLTSKVLRTGADNPYANEGVRDFTIELRDGKVAGFTFGGDTFGLVAASPEKDKALDAAAMVGSYQRNPVENDWHKGQITAGANNTLIWTNAAGVSWRLTPDLANKTLRTGADNPYANDGVRDFTIELKDGKVAGFVFGEDLYQRRP